MSPQLLTREKAQAFQTQDAQGYLFHLPVAKQDVRVRRLSLATLAIAGGVPSHMQEMVIRIFREAQAQGTFVINKWSDLERNQTRQLGFANPLCIAGFMQPQLVATKEEADAADDPNVLWVEEISPDDRIAYMMSITDPQSEAAKALEPFSDEGASSAEPGEVVPPATETISGDGTQVKWSEPVGVPEL